MSTPVSGGFPLYLAVEHDETTKIAISGNFPLFLVGNTSGVSGVFNSFSLYLQVDDTLNTNFPLYLLGDSIGHLSSGIPLYLTGTAYSLNNSLDLFVLGPSGLTSSLPLYLAGASYSYFNDPFFPSDGFIPFTGGMPLYLERPFGIDFPLYVCNNLVVSGSLPLYLFGAFGVSSGFPLVIPNTQDTFSNTLKLFCRGGI